MQHCDFLSKKRKILNNCFNETVSQPQVDITQIHERFCARLKQYNEKTLNAPAQSLRPQDADNIGCHSISPGRGKTPSVQTLHRWPSADRLKHSFHFPSRENPGETNKPYRESISCIPFKLPSKTCFKCHSTLGTIFQTDIKRWICQSCDEIYSDQKRLLQVFPLYEETSFNPYSKSSSYNKPLFYSSSPSRQPVDVEVKMPFPPCRMLKGGDLSSPWLGANPLSSSGFGVPHIKSNDQTTSINPKFYPCFHHETRASSCACETCNYLLLCNVCQETSATQNVADSHYGHRIVSLDKAGYEISDFVQGYSVKAQQDLKLCRIAAQKLQSLQTTTRTVSHSLVKESGEIYREFFKQIAQQYNDFLGSLRAAQRGVMKQLKKLIVETFRVRLYLLSNKVQPIKKLIQLGDQNRTLALNTYIKFAAPLRFPSDASFNSQIASDLPCPIQMSWMRVNPTAVPHSLEATHQECEAQATIVLRKSLQLLFCCRERVSGSFDKLLHTEKIKQSVKNSFPFNEQLQYTESPIQSLQSKTPDYVFQETMLCRTSFNDWALMNVRLYADYFLLEPLHQTQDTATQYSSIGQQKIDLNQPNLIIQKLSSNQLSSLAKRETKRLTSIFNYSIADGVECIEYREVNPNTSPEAFRAYEGFAPVKYWLLASSSIQVVESLTQHLAEIGYSLSQHCFQPHASRPIRSTGMTSLSLTSDTDVQPHDWTLLDNAVMLESNQSIARADSTAENNADYIPFTETLQSVSRENASKWSETSRAKENLNARAPVNAQQMENSLESFSARIAFREQRETGVSDAGSLSVSSTEYSKKMTDKAFSKAEGQTDLLEETAEEKESSYEEIENFDWTSNISGSVRGSNISCTPVERKASIQKESLGQTISSFEINHITDEPHSSSEFQTTESNSSFNTQKKTDTDQIGVLSLTNGNTSVSQSEGIEVSDAVSLKKKALQQLQTDKNLIQEKSVVFKNKKDAISESDIYQTNKTGKPVVDYPQQITVLSAPISNSIPNMKASWVENDSNSAFLSHELEKNYLSIDNLSRQRYEFNDLNQEGVEVEFKEELTPFLKKSVPKEHMSKINAFFFEVLPSKKHLNPLLSSYSSTVICGTERSGFLQYSCDTQKLELIEPDVDKMANNNVNSVKIIPRINIINRGKNKTQKISRPHKGTQQFHDSAPSPTSHIISTHPEAQRLTSLRMLSKTRPPEITLVNEAVKTKKNCDSYNVNANCKNVSVENISFSRETTNDKALSSSGSLTSSSSFSFLLADSISSSNSIYDESTQISSKSQTKRGFSRKSVQSKNFFEKSSESLPLSFSHWGLNENVGLDIYKGKPHYLIDYIAKLPSLNTKCPFNEDMTRRVKPNHVLINHIRALNLSKPAIKTTSSQFSSSLHENKQSLKADKSIKKTNSRRQVRKTTHFQVNGKLIDSAFLASRPCVPIANSSVKQTSYLDNSKNSLFKKKVSSKNFPIVQNNYSQPFPSKCLTPIPTHPFASAFQSIANTKLCNANPTNSPH